MNTRKIIKFLINTFLIGGAAGLVISFFIKWDDYATHLNPFNVMEILGLVLFFIGLGLTFSVISMTGYFAYLYIHRFGINLFRSFWPIIQIVLVLFVLFDLVYFPYRGSDGELNIYLLLLGVILFSIYAWFIAKLKAKETNQTAFVPALFFMVVMTTLEWTPALMAGGEDYIWLMLAPLLICNTYLLIGSHRIANKIDGKSAKDPARKDVQPEKTSKKRKKSSKA
ncbi:KinB-signaling pathway activation protein [Oceanobacillus sp. CAU 1775]